jgi:hypothetical protein
MARFDITDPIGPILILDGVPDGTVALSALFILPRGREPSSLEAEGKTHSPSLIARYETVDVWRTRFSLPASRASSYRWNGQSFPVATDLTGDLRLAYVSCNGEEVGDLAREGTERNAMWARLAAEHREAPFALLLHGGDQVYADEVTEGHRLSEAWPERIPEDVPGEALEDLRHHLRERFMERYAVLYRAPEFAWIAARVPSLMQWDDHDICDGWGSLPPDRTNSPVGRVLFDVARENALVFQHAAREGDLPSRFADPAGGHLGWAVHLPGVRLLAPDLRTERTPERIMGPGGWAMMEAEAARPAAGQTLLLSSVPLLGPRMSLFERLMLVVPGMQKYEDDLRDQWQSRAHRDEWRRMLRLVLDIARTDRQDVVALSGEIHLATRARMDLGDGRDLHQLVASGIAHRPPPRGWARFLGAVASLGEDPLPEHPIRIERLPGRTSRYVAERNYLVLERSSQDWRARWVLEDSGTTPDLALGSGGRWRRNDHLTAA